MWQIHTSVLSLRLLISRAHQERRNARVELKGRTVVVDVWACLEPMDPNNDHFHASPYASSPLRFGRRADPGRGPVGNFSLVAPAHAQADVVITASMTPQALPVYSQPPIPGAGYIWSPGYWAFDGQEYYWVPGYWQIPPAADLLWTPDYWAWNGAGEDCVFHSG